MKTNILFLLLFLSILSYGTQKEIAPLFEQEEPIFIPAEEHQELQKELFNKEREAHRVYFIIGKTKDLVLKKIIRRAKGLTLDYTLSHEVNLDDLTETSIYELDSIHFTGGSPKIIGAFPKQSYRLLFDKRSKRGVLRILDKDLFWQNDRIFVLAYR